jgi:hypothetical protein
MLRVGDGGNLCRIVPFDRFSISGFARWCLMPESFFGVEYNRIVLCCLLLELYLNVYC